MMFACFLAEWREWIRLRMGRPLAVSAALVFAVTAFSAARPIFIVWALGAWSLGWGWYQGAKARQRSSEWERSLPDGTPAFHVLAGKTLAAGLGYLAALAFLSPPLALMAFVWAPSAGPTILAALAWPPLFLLGLGVGLSATLTTGDDGGFIGTLLLFIWFFSTLLVPRLNLLNPFYQAWNALSGGPLHGSLICIGSTIALAAVFLLFALAGERIGGRRRDA